MFFEPPTKMHRQKLSMLDNNILNSRALRSLSSHLQAHTNPTIGQDALTLLLFLDLALLIPPHCFIITHLKMVGIILQNNKFTLYISWVLYWSGTYFTIQGPFSTALLHISRVLYWSGIYFTTQTDQEHVQAAKDLFVLLHCTFLEFYTDQEYTLEPKYLIDLLHIVKGLRTYFIICFWNPNQMHIFSYWTENEYGNFPFIYFYWRHIFDVGDYLRR